MDKKQDVPIWMSAVLLALSIFGIIYYAYDAIRIINNFEFSPTVIVYIASFISLVLAIIYCTMGYKKNAAGIFKAYCVAMTIGYMASDYLYAPYLSNGEIKNTIMFFSILIQCQIWFVLAIAKDLGKKKSLCLCSILLLLQTISTILLALRDINTAIGSMVGVVAYIITYIMFYAKYQDKAARGTK